MIDRSRIEELRQCVGPKFGDLITQSVADLEQLSAVLRAASAGADETARALSLHALRGVALNLGLNELAAACARAEANAGGTQTDAQAADVVTCALRSIDALRTMQLPPQR